MALETNENTNLNVNANQKNILKIKNNIMKYTNLEMINKYLKELIVNFIFNLTEKNIKMIVIIMYLMKLIQILNIL